MLSPKKRVIPELRTIFSDSNLLSIEELTENLIFFLFCWHSFWDKSSDCCLKGYTVVDFMTMSFFQLFNLLRIKLICVVETQGTCVKGKMST